MTFNKDITASRAAVVGVCLLGVTPLQAQSLPGWDSVWSDEFNGTSVNTSRWEVADRRDSPNNELQYYRPEQVTVGNGGAIHIDDVSLIATDPVLIGDLNGDGFVGINDLNVILVNWNTSATPGAYFDPSGDGFVGIDDLNIVLAAWNAGVPPVSSTIPEPGTLALLGATGILFSGRKTTVFLRQ